MAAHLLHGGDDVGVGSAAADVAGHAVLHVFVGGADRLLQKSDGGHDLAGGAVAALVAVVLDEGGLHGMKIVGLADAFDGCYFLAGKHYRESETRVDAAAIDVDCTGAALAVVTALLGAGEVEAFAEKVEKRYAGFQSCEIVLFAVDEDRSCGSGSFLRGWRRAWHRCHGERRCAGYEAGSAQSGKEAAAAYAAMKALLICIRDFRNGLQVEQLLVVS